MKNNKAFNISLWVAQMIVSLLLLMAGCMKLVTPIADLSKKLPWVAEVPVMAVKVLSLLDIAGGVGILLPALLKIKPQLTAFAAKGIVVLMISAIAFHVLRGELSVIGFNIVILLLAVFVSWGRATKLPIPARN